MANLLPQAAKSKNNVQVYTRSLVIFVGMTIIGILIATVALVPVITYTKIIEQYRTDTTVQVGETQNDGVLRQSFTKELRAAQSLSKKVAAMSKIPKVDYILESLTSDLAVVSGARLNTMNFAYNDDDLVYTVRLSGLAESRDSVAEINAVLGDNELVTITNFPVENFTAHADGYHFKVMVESK